MRFFDGLAAGVGAFEELIGRLVAVESAVNPELGATSSYTSYEDMQIWKWGM